MKPGTIRPVFRETACDGIAELDDAFNACILSVDDDGRYVVDLESAEMARFVELRTKLNPLAGLKLGAEGIAKRVIGLKVVSADVHDQRRAVCDACPELEKKKIGLITLDRCKLCGCMLDAKAWLSEEKFTCPAGKWDGIVDQPIDTRLTSQRCQDARNAVCDTCEHLRVVVDGEMSVRKCADCSCLLAPKVKLRLPQTQCRLGKWKHIPLE